MFRGDRLDLLMRERGLSQSELGRRIGVSQGTIWKLLNDPKASSRYVHQVAREVGTTPEFLMGETDDASAGYVPVPSIVDVASSLNLVPVREIDLSLGMGATYLEVPVTETTRHFDRAWLRTYTHASPEDLLFAQGLGDSMMPTIHDSDLLLIDCSQKSVTMTDKIWAIAYANCGAVKRLRPRADGGVEMISDNPLVPNDTAYDGELHVLGRVVAVVRKV